MNLLKLSFCCNIFLSFFFLFDFLPRQVCGLLLRRIIKNSPRLQKPGWPDSAPYLALICLAGSPGRLSSAEPGQFRLISARFGSGRLFPAYFLLARLLAFDYNLQSARVRMHRTFHYLISGGGIKFPCSASCVPFHVGTFQTRKEHFMR